LLVLSFTTFAGAVTVSIPDNTNAGRMLSLEVIVNGAQSGTWLLVEHAGELYASQDAFENWRVQLPPEAQRIQVKGRDYWPLAAVLGYKSKVNFVNQSLELMFSPQAFAETRLTITPPKASTVSPTLPSIFINYDLNYQRTELRAAPTLQSVGMLSEVGFSSNLGVLTNSALNQNLTDTTIPIRLETTMTTIFPNNNKTLRLGDTSTRAGMLGTSVYYGGFQFGTNITLVPGFVSQPIPILTGLSAAPSTVNLFINDVLRQTSNVPTGPFSIDNFPALTGEGEARLVVRDLLGRETVITKSFFSSTKLLAADLDDWSIEGGRVRRDLGISSANYGSVFARGIWRHGYNDNLTLEGVAETTSRQSLLGLGLVSSVFGPWLSSAAFAASSEADLGKGVQWLLGLERQGLRNSIFLQVQGASVNFRDLGQDLNANPIKLQVAANWTYASDRFGTFGMGTTWTRPFNEDGLGTMTLSYSMHVGERGSLSMSANQSLGVFSDSSVGLSLVLPLDSGRVVGAESNSNGKQNDLYLTASQNPTQENNLGWRVLVGQQQDNPHQEGGLSYMGQYGNLNGNFSSSPDQNVQRLSVNGGLVLAAGHLFATRHQRESFALAEVAGYGNVGIGLGNNVLTRTDANGIALIPHLVPYQKNSVQLDPKDLPLSAELDSIEQNAVPAWRSVVKVTFPVRSGRGALLKIKLDDGGVAPAGAILQIEGDQQEFYVARRGEAFVTGLQPINRVLLKWNNQLCKFGVTLPPEEPDQIPRMGPLLCSGVSR
jgi:outer membrane usher protein